MCTTPFGMSVDVPNVDILIRIGCPSSFKELAQEFGRAGRGSRLARGNILENNLMYYVIVCRTVKINHIF